MQTLKNIHKEYLNKLAEEIVNKACFKECKCDSDDLTEKKKCLFRKSLDRNDMKLVDLWFDMIDAISEVIYTKSVDSMAHPDLIRLHFSQTKAKSFYEVLSDEFESVILDIYIKVCLKISDVCKENPGFKKIIDYAEEQLLEYFTFETAFSYSRYMIENHSYIEEWFPIANIDTKEILEISHKEPTLCFAQVSRNNYKNTENLENLVKYTYEEMYKKKLGWLKNVFSDGIFNTTCDYYKDNYMDFGKDEDDYLNGLKNLIECYQNLGVTREMFYGDVNEKIGYIMTGDSHNAKRKKEEVRDIIDEDGNLIKEKFAGNVFENDEMLAKSRLEIYKSQLAPLHDNRLHLNRDKNSHSNGKLNKLVRDFYKDLYGLDLSKIYKKAPYTFKKKENDETKKVKKTKSQEILH